MTLLSNNGILVNLSTMVSAEAVVEYISDIKHESFDLRFVYDDYRFKIEKHHINDWTIAIENAKIENPEQPELFLEHIGSLDFFTILNSHIG